MTQITLPDGREAAIRLKPHARARRLSLRVVPQPFPHIAVTVPPRTRAQSALDFAKRQSAWIAAHLPQVRTICDGGEILWRGTPHRTIWAGPAVRSEVWAEDNRLYVRCGDAIFAESLKRWMKSQARVHLVPRVTHYAERVQQIAAQPLGLRTAKLCDHRSQWGRCNAQGDIVINWRLMMAPETVSDYVAAHEAAHLGEMNHSKSFWSLVDALVSERKKAQRWLKTEGSGLMF